MTARLFDLRGLFLAVDAERQRQDLSWQVLARQIGVAASTIRRFGEAEDAEADGVLAAVGWLGVVPEDFVNGQSASGRRLPDACGGCIRVDMELVARAAGDPRGAQGRTRTSIQRLTEVAQRSGQPIASLARFSTV